jgi:CheY-like chemotaxis protein
VRRFDGLDAALEGHAARGRQHADTIGHSLQQASQDMDATLDRFAQWLVTAQGRGQAGVSEREVIARELQRLKADEVAQHFRSVATTLQPVQCWAGNLQHDIAPQVRAVRALKATAERVQRMVLIVDDDDFQRKLLERMLGDAGYETVSAASAVEALAAVARRRPDLVLMDVELPDFDGVEATSRIKAVEGQSVIPVLMITGHSNKDVIFSSVMAGSAGFLVKPFDKGLLLAKVSRCLEAAAAVAVAA